MITESKILLIEYNETRREYIVKALESNGFIVYHASSPSSGLDSYSTSKYEIVIVNSQFPEISGIEILKKIKKINSEAIVFLISDKKDFEECRAAIKNQAFDFILYPINEEEFIFSIKNALKKYSDLNSEKIHQEDLERTILERTETLKFQKEALEREQERTRGIIEESHIGFLVLDGESEEVFLLNKQSKILLNIIEEFSQNYFLRNFREIFPENINILLEKIINKVQIHKKVLNCGDLKIGDESILHFAAYPIMIEDNVSSIVVAVEDITDRKKLEQQIIQSSRLADLGEMAAVIGHEINNPIAFVNSNTQSLTKYLNKITTYLETVHDIEDFLEQLDINEDKILDIYQGVLSINDEIQKKKEELKTKRDSLKIDKALTNISQIIKENLDGLDRVRKIVLDLRTFSHMGEDHAEEVDINKVIDDTINIIWNEIKYKCEIIKKFTSIPLLKCFPRQISQVFSNIIMNGAHSIEKKGTITISTFYENQAVKISINDTGSGMDEETREKIFNPFFTTKKMLKGTGLGLSICLKIIDKHNGNIMAESEPGKGTTFIISLPLSMVQETKDILS